MADRRSTRLLQRAQVNGRVLTAATKPLDQYDQTALTITPTEPQREAWNYFHALGEVNFGISSWLANSISRCRLVAAEQTLGADDPTPLADGPAAQIVGQMATGSFGQASLLNRMAVQISVAGESFLVTENVDSDVTTTVYSNQEIRITGRNPLLYQVYDQRAIWRPLSPESLVSRVWWPDPEVAWMASSPVLAALPIMREIDMYNRYIMAILLSRVVNNGILMVPSEVTFPSLPQFKDEADPFMAQLIDAAQKAIKNPGSAGAALPLPLKVPSNFIEKFRHMTFATEMGDKVLDDRNKALVRLATALNLPAEVLTGMGDVNHWGQWQLEESAVKIHIVPVLEVMCEALTKSYLWPMMKSMNLATTGPDGSTTIVWYDFSALVQQPDRTQQAQALWDRMAITTKALVRESGFNESDIPESNDDMKEQALRKLAMSGGADSMAALSILVDDPSIAEVPQKVTVSPGTDTSGAPGSAPSGDSGAPTNGPNPPSGQQPSPQGPQLHNPPAR